MSTIHAIRPARHGASLLVLPRRGLWPGYDAGDIRIFSLVGGWLNGPSTFGFEPTSSFRLLLFLSGAFPRALVLRRS